MTNSENYKHQAILTPEEAKEDCIRTYKNQIKKLDLVLDIIRQELYPSELSKSDLLDAVFSFRYFAERNETAVLVEERKRYWELKIKELVE